MEEAQLLLDNPSKHHATRGADGNHAWAVLPEQFARRALVDGMRQLSWLAKASPCSGPCHAVPHERIFHAHAGVRIKLLGSLRESIQKAKLAMERTNIASPEADWMSKAIALQKRASKYVGIMCGLTLVVKASKGSLSAKAVADAKKSFHRYLGKHSVEVPEAFVSEVSSVKAS